MSPRCRWPKSRSCGYASAIKAYQDCLGAFRALHGLQQEHRVEVEKLRDDELPERTPAVQGPADEVGGEGGQLLAAAGRRDPGAPHVVVEVEVGILDPHRMMEVEGNRGQSLTELRDQVQPLADDVLRLLE